MKLRWSIMVAFALALTALFVSAGPLVQFQGGTITGTVADEVGAVIPGVTVTAVESQSGVRATAVTNESGVYTIAGLQPGTYTVTARLPGFESQTFPNNILVRNGDRVPLAFKLRVGAVALPLGTLVPKDIRFSADVVRTEGPVVRYRGNVEMATNSFVLGADELDFNSTTLQVAARGAIRMQLVPAAVGLRPQ